MLVIDEFYKADETLDSERAINLKRIMMDLAPKAKQKYYLSPPISFEALKADNNMFTKDMECIPLDFNTVISEISYEYKKQELKDRNLKNKRLLEIIQSKKTKTLIYAGTYNKIKEVSDILLSALPDKDNAILDSFSDWLKNNYGQNYPLSALIKKGTGIHNGQLHRALAQIQVRLFEEEDCINNIISTSSIIEGVNTSTENVIIWSNKNGTAKLNNFTYKNIIGRGGRMFRHFVGKIYIFEAPPNDDSTELTLSASEDFLKSSDTEDFKQDLTKDQIKEIIDFNKEMDALLGEGNYDKLKKEKQLLSIKPSELLNVAKNMKKNPKKWERLKYLNFNNPQSWRSPIHLVLQTLNLQIEPYSLVIKAVQYFSHNWRKTIPQILEESGISIDKFFKIERYAAFKLASTLNDINIIYKLVAHSNIDISPFIAKLSHAFLPKHVYELEEYGLPRMLSKKIQESGIIDLEKSESDIQNIIDEFINIRQENLEKKITNLHPFESYILKFFYDGITSIH